MLLYCSARRVRNSASSHVRYICCSLVDIPRLQRSAVNLPRSRQRLLFLAGPVLLGLLAVTLSGGLKKLVMSFCCTSISMTLK